MMGSTYERILSHSEADWRQHFAELVLVAEETPFFFAPLPWIRTKAWRRPAHHIRGPLIIPDAGGSGPTINEVEVDTWYLQMEIRVADHPEVEAIHKRRAEALVEASEPRTSARSSSAVGSCDSGHHVNEAGLEARLETKLETTVSSRFDSWMARVEAKLDAKMNQVLAQHSGRVSPAQSAAAGPVAAAAPMEVDPMSA